MSQSEVTVLLVGDKDSGKSKFIEKLLLNYPDHSIIHQETGEKYVCRIKDADCVICLYDANDISEAQKIYTVDVIILSHTLDNPETFRSLLERWIPYLKVDVDYSVLMDNSSTQQENLTEKQQSSLSNEQVMILSHIFGLVWCTAYSSEYKEVLYILKNVLEEKSTEKRSVSDDSGSNKFSENSFKSNNCSPGELNQSEYATTEIN